MLPNGSNGHLAALRRSYKLHQDEPDLGGGLLTAVSLRKQAQDQTDLSLLAQPSKAMHSTAFTLRPKNLGVADRSVHYTISQDRTGTWNDVCQKLLAPQNKSFEIPENDRSLGVFTIQNPVSRSQGPGAALNSNGISRASVQDTSFGLTQSELVILRQVQQVAQQDHRRENMPNRGRKTIEHSQNSSSAVSVASGQSGRISLDAPSLLRLYTSLDNLYHQIVDRISQLEEATEQRVDSSRRGGLKSIKSADEEIERVRKILREIDRLEEKCNEVKRVRDVVERLHSRSEAQMAETTTDELSK